MLEQGDSGSPFNRKIMANDRMYIRCKGCGELHYLAKCYDDGYFTTHEGEELRQGLDDFFDRHKWCYRDKYYGGFELVYESDEDAENEDERIREWLVNYFKAAGKSWIHRDMSPEQILAYLEKQKEQKPDWSEEDEEMLNSCISSIEEAKENRYAYKETDGDTSYDHEISWLKFLRPQYHGDVTMTEAYKMGLEAGEASSWKPSEEQMNKLKEVIYGLCTCGNGPVLKSLYEDLKKLI